MPGLFATRVLTLLLALGAAGCSDDSVGPGGSSAGLSVRVASVAAPTYSFSPDSVAIIGCDVSLRAQAEGFGIEWQSAMFRWYLDSARTQPFDSVEVDAGTIQQSWGGANLAPGGAANADWKFQATIPFTLSLQYRFADAQGNGGITRPVAFSCRPPIAANSAPPSVTNVQVLPANEVEPGDTITVRYAVSSGAGLWQTVVGTTGACDTLIFVPGRLSLGGTRDVHLVLPHGCVSGQQLQVVVQSLDAAVRIATGYSGLIPVQDRTPPSLDLTIYHPDDGSTDRRLEGNYFGLDSILAVPFPLDNGVVRSLHWSLEPGGFQDSVSLVGLTGPVVPLVLPSGLNGSYQLSLFVRDGAGNASSPITSAPGAFTIRPTVARPTVAQTIVGDARDAVIDEPRGKVYMLLGNRKELVVLSLSTLAIERTLSLSSVTTGLDLSEGGDSLLLAMTGSTATRPHGALGVIDLRQSSLHLVENPLFDGVDGGDWKAIAAVGGQLFMNRTDGSASTVQVDLHTGVERFRQDLTSYAMVRSLDRKVVALGRLWGTGAAVAAYDPVLDVVSSPVAVTPGNFLSVDRTGDHIAVQLNVFNKNLQLIRTIPHNFGIGVPVSILSADGSYLHYLYAGYVIRAGVGDGRSVDRVPFPYRSDFFRVSTSGNYLLSIHGFGWPQSTVVVIDLR